MAIAFALLVSGTSAGWLVPWIRLINVVMIAVLVAFWVRSIARGMDLVDGASILLIVAVGASAVLSVVPRLSADAFHAALAFVALFGLARRLDPATRQVGLKALGLLLAVLAPTYLALWALAWYEWIQATGQPPSLAMELPSAPFGQRHNVALLLGLLLPAVLERWSSGTTRRLALVGLIGITIVVAFMSGGRAVWLAAGIATVVAVVASSRTEGMLRWLGRHWLAMAALTIILVATLLASGIGGSLVSRAFATESLDIRAAIWGSAFNGWSERPLVGSGPGTFQLALHSTDYYDQSVYAPRHADNLYLQTLTELGAIGSVALVLLVFAIVRTWGAKRPSPSIAWVLVFVGVTGIGANPAALGYCAILIAFWAGLAAPWSPSERGPMPRWVHTAVPVGLALVALIPILTTAGAAFAYDRAREQTDAGEVGRATESLDEAVLLDPTFPLYRRERGIVHFRNGSDARAVADLRSAAEMNPFDDSTLRSLAVVSLEAGHSEEALAAARKAAGLQATDPTNQATLALAADAGGFHEESDAALARLLVLAPWSAADPSWAEVFPDNEPSSALRDAAELAGVRPPADTIDTRWTQVLAGASGVTAEAGFTAPQVAFGQLLNCRPAKALVVIEQTDRAAASTDPDYAFTQAVVARLNGAPSDPAGPPVDPLAGPVVGDPVGDQARYARRSPLPWQGIELPSNTGGRLAWLDDPADALRVTRGSPCP